MAKRDYYEVLAVQRDCSEKELKTAYRKLALELHPDRNPDDPTAEERFKEASEAYQVLTDAQKRAVYDRYGHAGLEGAGHRGFTDVQDIFGQFTDIFGDIFGGGGFGGFGRSRRREGPARGADLQTTAQLTLKEAVLGVKREIKLNHPQHCQACQGTGAKDGTAIRTCPTCEGAGQVTQSRGMFLLQTACPDCRGAGRMIETPCPECKGSGETQVERTVKVTFPAGIDEGQTLRVPNQGLPGRLGGPQGHLYVTVQIEADERFQREGQHLVHELSVSFPQAALGDEVEVQTLDDRTLTVKIPPGVQPGESILVKGEGVPDLRGRARGDLVCVVQVQVPTQLSANARKLLKQLADTLQAEA